MIISALKKHMAVRKVAKACLKHAKETRIAKTTRAKFFSVLTAES